MMRELPEVMLLEFTSDQSGIIWYYSNTLPAGVEYFYTCHLASLDLLQTYISLL